MAGTFGWIPDTYKVEEVGHKTKINTYESGEEQRASKTVNPRRKFYLSFKDIEETESDAIYQFYLNQKGAWDEFTWYDPIAAENVTVRFFTDGLSRDEFMHQLYNTEVVFIEIV